MKHEQAIGYGGDRTVAAGLTARLGGRCDKCGDRRAVSIVRKWHARSNRYVVTGVCAICEPPHRQAIDLDRRVELQRTAMRRLRGR